MLTCFGGFAHRRIPHFQRYSMSLEATLAPYRRFRHVAFHSYGVQLEWSRMAEGVARIDNVFSQIKAKLADYLRMIENSEHAEGQP